MSDQLYYPILIIMLFGIEELYFYIARKYNIIDKPNNRSSHTQVTLRGGGIIFVIGVVLYMVLHPAMMISDVWFGIGLILISAISFIDDVRGVGRLSRLAIHLVSMLLLIVQWQLYDAAWWYIIVALFFSIGTINAYNFMDGINGITGGYSLVLLVSLSYINLYQLPQPFVSEELLHTITLAVLVFCFYNFRRKAKCFAGDVGSVSIAYIIIFVLGLLILATRDLSYLTLLMVYGVDSVLTICHRIMLGENIGEPHRKHAYQILANELKVPHVIVSMSYMAIQALVNIGYFLTPVDKRYYYFVIALFLLSMVYIIFMQKYFYLHKVEK